MESLEVFVMFSTIDFVSRLGHGLARVHHHKEMELAVSDQAKNKKHARLCQLSTFLVSAFLNSHFW